MIYDTKTISCILELHITQRQLGSPEKQNPAQLTVMEIKLCVKLLHYHTYTMSAYIFLISGILSIEPQISRVPIHFYLNIQYPDNRYKTVSLFAFVNLLALIIRKPQFLFLQQTTSS